MIELQSAASDPEAGGQVIRMNLRLSRSSQIMYGTFAVTGGCDDGDNGDVTGRFVPDLSGNWSGTFDGAPATAALTQAQVASGGWFALTGTIFSPCFTSAIVTSFMSGGIIALSLNDGTLVGTGIVQDAPIGKRLFLEAFGRLGVCVIGIHSGTLTRR